MAPANPKLKPCAVTGCIPTPASPSNAAPLLMAAIRKHAWTFVGAGAFAPSDAWHFSIDREAARDSLPPPESLFVWYAAVFTRLFCVLVAGDCTCRMIEPDVPCDMARSYAISRG